MIISFFCTNTTLTHYCFANYYFIDSINSRCVGVVTTATHLFFAPLTDTSPLNDNKKGYAVTISSLRAALKMSFSRLGSVTRLLAFLQTRWCRRCFP